MMQREGFSIRQACTSVGLSRAGFYRQYEQDEPQQADVELRAAIHEVALESRSYGYRRVSEELQHQGWEVNHKRVLRLMREDNLLALRKRRYVLTSNSQPRCWIYPNLVPELQLNGLNQLWVADITYVRLRETFVYLAVVLDAYSRKAIGWELGDTLEASLALTALRRALAERVVAPGAVHHSDRGVQYAAQEYVGLLEAHGFRISMSRPGNPYDNARAESFMKTLKCEEVYLKQYRDAAHARASIGTFIEEIYNRKRLHSALGYQSPETFEAQAAAREVGR